MFSNRSRKKARTQLSSSCLTVFLDRKSRSHETRVPGRHMHRQLRTRALVLTLPNESRCGWPPTENMLRPWSQQARQPTPRRETVAHIGNQGCYVPIHTGNLSPLGFGGLVCAGVSWTFSPGPVVLLVLCDSYERRVPVRRRVSSITSSSGGPAFALGKGVFASETGAKDTPGVEILGVGNRLVRVLLVYRRSQINVWWCPPGLARPPVQPPLNSVQTAAWSPRPTCTRCPGTVCDSRRLRSRGPFPDEKKPG